MKSPSNGKNGAGGKGEDNDSPEVLHENRVIELAEPINGFSTVEFTPHVIQRMKERKVGIQDVLKAMQNGTQIPYGQQKGRVRVRWNKSQRERIDVVYCIEKDRLGVITVIPFRSFRR